MLSADEDGISPPATLFRHRLNLPTILPGRKPRPQGVRCMQCGGIDFSTSSKTPYSGSSKMANGPRRIPIGRSREIIGNRDQNDSGIFPLGLFSGSPKVQRNRGQLCAWIEKPRHEINARLKRVTRKLKMFQNT
jgi:hypothetical protein